MSLATDIQGVRDWLIDAGIGGIRPADIDAIAESLKDCARRAAALELAMVGDHARQPAGPAMRLVHSAEALPAGGAA